MSKIVHDFITAIKGIRGAGDTIRGEVMDATDRVFDNKFNHKETEEAQAKNRALAEKGRQEMRDADLLIGRHDFDPKDEPATVATPTATTTTTTTDTTTTATGPAPTLPPRTVPVTTAEEGVKDVK
ncbi:hypothetical protein F4821DRAFT_259910 [Hypoxylon rubiginosum]|uniref:Uncharacterized protein n=1 Tax=Hypoxylon rubiginosum TaxID=110542 RepID=A0ACC0D1A2_9PEZI|nr:hypothetical protein F4821DRAFT_259910 [Hypoxylon rubiginosum]